MNYVNVSYYLTVTGLSSLVTIEVILLALSDAPILPILFVKLFPQKLG